jgi:hypothetical protein
VLSGAAHGVVVLALIGAASAPGPAPELAPIAVQLIQLPPVVIPPPTIDPLPAPAIQPPAPGTPKRQSIARRSHAPPVAEPLRVAPAAHTAAVASSGVDNARFAGAQGVGDGPPGGGACDMARRVQAALRKDPLVQAAVAHAGGGPIMVWDGDWVQNGVEDGKGLAAVREAITWEVAFAPAACKAEPVRGLILLSMNQPGSAKLALGQGAWRWSDLLR